MSGLMSVTGEGPGRPPVKIGPPIADITASMLAAMVVSAAYASKLQTGLGQRVDTSPFEAGIPAGPILNIPQMHRVPQALARAMVVEVEHPRAGNSRLFNTLRWSDPW